MESPFKNGRKNVRYSSPSFMSNKVFYGDVSNEEIYRTTYQMNMGRTVDYWQSIKSSKSKWKSEIDKEFKIAEDYFSKTFTKIEPYWARDAEANTVKNQKPPKPYK